MNHANFDWFLHTMLHLHNLDVEARIKKEAEAQSRKRARRDRNAMDVDDEPRNAPRLNAGSDADDYDIDDPEIDLVDVEDED